MDRRRHRWLRRAALAVGLLAAVALPPTASADEAPAQVTTRLQVAMSDGVALDVQVGGRAPLVDGQLPARPVIIEMSPYAPGCCAELGGPGFNYVQVHTRGTGRSGGSFDALGPRTQQDVAEIAAWACEQPWSDGHLGLYGFSASAITVYNSLHLELPCVDAAVLGSGTHELYRDLLYPGGVPNGVPALGVFALIGAPFLQSLAERDPATLLDAAAGLARLPLDYQAHPTLDAYWQERGFRGDANDLPILMIDGFFDVESRGAFQAFQELRDDGAHLLVVGAHDGVPVGSDGGAAQQHAWYDRYLRGVDNGIDAEPAVQLLLADGDREDMLVGGRFVTASGDDWPLPGTAWRTYHLAADATLTTTSPAPGVSTTQSYASLASWPGATDPYNTAILGVNTAPPWVTDMTLAEPVGLSFTTPPFASPVLAAGPASAELVLSSTAPETDLYVVLSDVWPDGTAHPMAAGRLRSSYPGIDLARSLVDGRGHVVQPYGRYDVRDPAAPGVERRYHVELWPIGNRFEAGHRLRLHVLSVSGASQPTTPAIDTIRLGAGGSRLYFPVLPG